MEPHKVRILIDDDPFAGAPVSHVCWVYFYVWTRYGNGATI